MRKFAIHLSLASTGQSCFGALFISTDRCVHKQQVINTAVQTKQPQTNKQEHDECRTNAFAFL